MEKHIGETFQHAGKTFEVCHAMEYKSCKGCAFCEPDGNRCTLNRVENDVPECIGLHRADGLNVVFVEASENEEPRIEKFAEEEALKMYPAEQYIDAVRQAYVNGFLGGYVHVYHRIEDD